MPTTTLATIRQKVAKKIYAARFPIVSVTTANSDSQTVLTDALLAPAAQVEDYVETWIFVAEQPAAVATATPSTVDGAHNTTTTTLAVTAGTDFLAGDGIQVTVAGVTETMRVTTVATNNLTVVRGIQDSTAVTMAGSEAVTIVGPAVGEIARVTNTDFASSASSLTIEPALSASLVSGTDYEIHYKFYPNHVRDKANEILENIRRPVLLPLGLITDGDMETSGTDSWTAAGTGGTPTLAKDTTTVLHGRQTLSITNGASTTRGFAKSGSVYLPPLTTVFVSADVYITGGDSAKLTLYDVTNSEDIETAASGATGWVHLEFTAALPSTCEEVQLWLESAAASDVTYWGSAQLLPTNRAIYDFPGTLEWSEDLDQVVYFPKGTALSASTDDNAYAIFGGARESWGSTGTIRDETAVTPFRIQLQKIGINQALYVMGAVDYATLTDDTDTTNAPEDIVVALTYADLLDAWAQEDESAGRIEQSESKAKKAASVRRLLAPRMMHFWRPKGRVSGTMR